MDLPSILNSPAFQGTAVAGSLSAFSTLHTYLGKHPRTQATFKLLAHLAGPFNLPAVWRGIVSVAKEIVAADNEVEQVIAVEGPNTDDVAKAVVDHFIASGFAKQLEAECLKVAQSEIAKEVKDAPKVPEPTPEQAKQVEQTVAGPAALGGHPMPTGTIWPKVGP